MPFPLLRPPLAPRTSRRAAWALASCLLAACRVPPRPVLHVLLRLPHDSVQFATGAAAQWCGRGRGVLVQGMVAGNGVLVWVRGDSVTGGDYPLLTRGDSTTPRGAKVSVRFALGEVARGVMLDSGRVTLTRRGATISGSVLGSGLEPAGGVRAGLRATLDSATLARDTANCALEL